MYIPAGAAYQHTRQDAWHTACLSMQVDNLSELLREVQMLRVTREVQAVISAATPGGPAAGMAAFQPASQHLQTLENLMKHNDRCLLHCLSLCAAMARACGRLT